MTIEFKGIEFDVEFDYQPEEPMVMYYADGSGYPGCAEECTLTDISHKGTDFMEFFEDDIEEIEEEILNQIHEG
jgi:hypothetical protein